MNPLSILLLGLAMSTDAFAAALGKGAAMRKPRIGQALRTGLIFGSIEAITPVIGCIDALAVGVSLAFVDTPIAVVAVVIGLCTFSMVTLGVMLGRVLGALVGKRAETIGGVILIGVGAAILYEHLAV